MLRLILLISLSVTLPVMALAGPSTGGGGDVVVLPNDKVVLADPFLNHSAKQPNNMPPLRALNPRLLQAVDAYLRAASNVIISLSSGSSDIILEMQKLKTRQSELRFYAVKNQEELNTFCAPGGVKVYKVPTGAKVNSVACTAGVETFLVEPLFIRLSLRDQAMILIHERLTTLRDNLGGKNYSAIARFTTGLNLFLDLYKEQAQRQYRRLKPQEQELLTEFYAATEEIEKRNSEIHENSFQWVAAINGGGRVHNLAQIDDTAIIGLNFVLMKGSIVGRNSRLLAANNYMPALVKIDDNVTLDRVSIQDGREWITVRSGVVVNDAHLSSSVEIGENAQIRETTLHYSKVGSQSQLFKAIIEASLVGSNNNISESKLTNVTTLNQVRVEKSTLNATHIEDTSEIRDSSIESISVIKLGRATKMERSKISYKGEAASIGALPIRLHGNEIKFADGSQLIDGLVDDFSLATYPEGTQLAERTVQWQKALNFQVYIGSNFSSRDPYSERTGLSQVFIDAEPWIKFSGHFMFLHHYQSRGLFKDNWYYLQIQNASYELSLKPSSTAADTRPNTYTLDGSGQLKKPGPYKFLDLDRLSQRSAALTDVARNARKDLIEKLNQLEGVAVYHDRFVKLPVVQ